MRLERAGGWASCQSAADQGVGVGGSGGRLALTLLSEEPPSQDGPGGGERGGKCPRAMLRANSKQVKARVPSASGGLPAAPQGSPGRPGRQGHGAGAPPGVRRAGFSWSGWSLGSW